MGNDFTDVRIHTDARAAESAEGLSAVAYTVGNDIVFSAGSYAPDSHEGHRLLAHELTHVTQQGGTLAGDRDSLAISEPDDALEREADRTAAALSSSPGERSAPLSAAPSTAAVGTVQRESEEESGDLLESLGSLFSVAHGATELPHAAVLPSVIEAGEAGAPIFPGLASTFGAGEASIEAGQSLYAAGEAAHHAVGGGASNLLGPLAMLAGGSEIYSNLSGDHVGLQNTAGAVAGGAEMISGATGTLGLLGSATGSAGLAEAAAATGPVGALLGAGAAGYALGNMIEEQTHVGTKAGDLAYDVLGPEPGLWLADHLPSWLQ